MSPPRLSLFRASVLAFCALTACTKQNKPADEPIGVTVGGTRLQKAERRRVLARPLVNLRGATLGPYLARQGEGLMMAYVSSAESELVAMPLLADGAPSGSAKILGRVPPETNALALRSLGRDGYAIVLRKPNDRGETLEVVGVQKDGSPFGKLAPLTTSQGRVVWFDVLRTGAGSVAVWAEDGDSADITLFSQPLEGNGKPIGVPLRVGKRAVAWSAAGGGNGAAIAWIARESALAAEGPLLVQRFDKQGQFAGTPVPVTPKARAHGEIEMIYANNAYVLGWTDARESPPQALIASVQEQGGNEAPRPIARRSRSSDLASLVAAPSGGQWLAAWRDGIGTAGGMQGRLSVGTPGGDPQSILHVSPRERVSGSLFEGGSAWLLSARPCQNGELTCDAPFEPQLHVIEGNEQRALRLERESSQALAVAWDLSCDDKFCVNLAAGPGNPTTVYSVSTSLADRTKEKAPASEAALASTVVTESSGAPVSIAAEGSLVAMLTELRTPGRFGVQVVPVSSELDAPKGLPPMLTQSALLAGGVAMAPVKDDGAIVAWTADDASVSHVHLARIDKTGARKNHVLLTQQKGDKSSVCVTRLNGTAKDAGYLVAWVDERSADPQIYATRVTPDLARVARETKLTSAPGDKSELGCVQVGDKVVMTWVDTRDDPSHTRGDIYTLDVRASDLSASGERAVLPTAPRSFSPLLRLRGNEPTVTWIEAGTNANESFVFHTSLVGAQEPQRRKIPAVIVGLVARAGDRVAALVSEGRKLALYDEPAAGGDLRRVGWLLDAPPPGTAAASMGGYLLFAEAGVQPALRAFLLP